MSPTEYPDREAPFAYACRRCGQCCRQMRVQTSPYDIARLSRRLGLTTGETAARYTQDGAGVFLDHAVDGACVFLSSEGCSVHPDRPLACRIYPLARLGDADGREIWRDVVPASGSTGLYGGAGTLAGFLAGQDVEDAIAAADAYADWARRAAEVLATAPGAGAENDFDAGDLLDMDVMIARHAAQTGEPAPADLALRVQLHLRILHAVLDDLERGEP